MEALWIIGLPLAVEILRNRPSVTSDLLVGYRSICICITGNHRECAHLHHSVRAHITKERALSAVVKSSVYHNTFRELDILFSTRSNYICCMNARL